MKVSLCLVVFTYFLGAGVTNQLPGRGINRGADWVKLAEEELQASIYNFPKVGVAKNVIIFIGDGMGPSDVTAARFLLAQQRGKPVTQTKLSFETFPVTGMSKTHTADRQTADSAGAATALLCGEKVNFYTVGVKDSVPLYNCSALSEETKLRSALKHSIDAGKWTGLVTNMRVTHASPSAAYAHSADRNGEANIPDTAIEPDKCTDIGQQLVEKDNLEIRVILGGGRHKLYPCNADVNGTCTAGERRDNRNITQEWLKARKDAKLPTESYKYITTADELKSMDEKTTDYVLGLFADSHMSYEHERKKTPDMKQPSLADMVDKALRILRRADKGYFLFVEGGLIDKGHHANQPYKALDETISLAEAVQRAMDLTDQEETLIVVTADHSHVFNIAGYPDIDNDILGTYISGWEPHDKMPYTTLQYANGPGNQIHRETEDGKLTQRTNLTGVDTTGPDYVFDAGIRIDDETHGGEDVAIYARGPMSYLLQGVHQQHYVAHALMYASCVGPDQGLCKGPLPTPPPTPPPTAPPGSAVGLHTTAISLPVVAVSVILILLKLL